MSTHCDGFVLLCIREDEYLVNMLHTVIPSWYQREGYIKSMTDLIEKELEKFGQPQEVIHKMGILCFCNFYCSMLKMHAAAISYKLTA